MSSNRVGRKVIGEWELERKLGTGSFASVFLARHIRYTGKQVAIKALSRGKLNSKLEKNLEKEIEILQGLEQENIVRLYETHETSKHIYLVMEYCAGGDLHMLLRKSGALPLEVCRNLMRQLAAGMYYLWTRSLIHRDLKPQNLLLTGKDASAVLKIADFGFATQLAEASMANTMCGSPLYMAPEILDGKKYDSKADLWSAGTILFEMLVGRPPFHGGSPKELLKNIMQARFVFPTGKVSVTPETVDLLQKLLNPDPLERISFEDFYNHSFFLHSHGSNGDTGMHVDREEAAFSDHSSLPDSGSDTSSSEMLFVADGDEDLNIGREEKVANQVKKHVGNKHPSSPLNNMSKKDMSREDEAWEFVSPEVDAAMQQNRVLRSLLGTRKSSTASEHTSAQRTAAVHVIRFSSELGRRASTLLDVAHSLLREDPEDPVYHSIIVVSSCDVPASVQGLSFSIKACKILSQAFDACQSVGGIGEESVLSSARVVRDDLKRSLQRGLDLAITLDRNAGKLDDSKELRCVEDLLWMAAMELAKAAASRELFAVQSSSIVLVEEALKLMQVVQDLVDLLCADPVFTSPPEHAKVLGFCATIKKRTAKQKSLRNKLKHVTYTHM